MKWVFLASVILLFFMCSGIQTKKLKAGRERRFTRLQEHHLTIELDDIPPLQPPAEIIHVDLGCGKEFWFTETGDSSIDSNYFIRDALFITLNGKPLNSKRPVESKGYEITDIYIRWRGPAPSC